MQFPVYFHLFGYTLHPHPVMELLGYSGGFQVYLLLRRRWTRLTHSPVVPIEQNLWVIVGAIFGALIGSKLLAWAESWADYFRFWKLTHSVAMFAGGKTIVMNESHRSIAVMFAPCAALLHDLRRTRPARSDRLT